MPPLTPSDARGGTLAWGSLVSDDPASLRKAVVELLLEESKALKWFPDHAKGYAAALVHRIHTHCDAHASLARGRDGGPAALAAARESLVQFCEREAEIIRKGLVSMPSRPGGVPGVALVPCCGCCTCWVTSAVPLCTPTNPVECTARHRPGCVVAPLRWGLYWGW